MADITITGEIAERLQEIARNTHQAVEEVLREALDRYTQDDLATRPSFAEMARLASENPIEVGAADISERSREILENEYAHYLLKHLHDGEVDE